VHEFVKVDAHVPGCPPTPRAIVTLLEDLLAGRKPEANPKVKFG
jgi:NAD-reducing hydrogenase small subunit